MRRADFVSVGETIAPLVKSHVGRPLHIVVARGQPGQGASQRHVGLTLTPAEWGGKGLLGCALK